MRNGIIASVHKMGGVELLALQQAFTNSSAENASNPFTNIYGVPFQGQALLWALAVWKLI